MRCKDDATGGWTEETAKKAASKRIALKACKVREERRVGKGGYRRGMRGAERLLWRGSTA